MSKSIKVHLSKSIHNSKFETILNSYTSLKSILSPNLSENYNIFINSLINIIISQLKIFIKILSLKDEKKIYKLLTSNNQNLSKQFVSLYDLPRIDPDILYNNKNRSYSLEEKRESFHENNLDNFELYNLNKNNTESKEEEIENNNNENNYINKNKDIVEEKIENGLNTERKKNKEYIIEKNKFIKINKPGKEKNIIRSLNFSGNKNNINGNKKEKNYMVKIHKNVKNIILNKILNKKEKKENKNNKFPSQRNINSIVFNNKNKKYSNTSKSTKYDYSSFRNKKEYLTKKLFDNKEKDKSLTKKITVIKSGTENKNKKGKQFKRKEVKSKTVIYREIPISFLIGITTQDNNNTNKKYNKNNHNNYISITYNNRITPRVKTPKTSDHKHKSINKKKKEEASSTNSSFKKIKKQNIKLNSPEYFSLDEFLIPNISKGGEKIFYNKTGKVIMNQKQKDILEDYINNYLFEEEITKIPNTERKDRHLSHKIIKEKILNIKPNKNKNFVIKGTSIIYNLKDVLDLLQLLPKSYNGPIDDFYLSQKRASMFDRSLFRICHKVIDNYKKLEKKERSFSSRRANSYNKIKINHRNKILILK